MFADFGVWLLKGKEVKLKGFLDNDSGFIFYVESNPIHESQESKILRQNPLLKLSIHQLILLLLNISPFGFKNY